MTHVNKNNSNINVAIKNAIIIKHNLSHQYLNLQEKHKPVLLTVSILYHWSHYYGEENKRD
jgi:hypothetical protein